MTHDGARKIPLVNQLLLILMGVLVIYLMVDFGRQVARSRQKHEELNAVVNAYRAALTEQEDLQAQLTYAQSNEVAEEWARSMSWAKQNEQTVVIVPPVADTSADEETATEGVWTPATQREAWWALFFGER